MLNSEVSITTIIQHFTGWPRGVFPGVHALLEQLKGQYRLALLTNTNELHWPRIANEFGILHHFEHCFASHQLDMAKPDPGIYAHVVETLQVRPDEIFFFDDKTENICAAIDSGMQAAQISSIDSLFVALRELTDE